MKKFSERMDMEICYVPAAKLKDVQEMMANWKKNNKIIRFSAIVAILMSFITMYYLVYSDSEGSTEIPIVMCIISMIILAFVSIIVTKSKKWIYFLSYLSTMLFSFSAACIDFKALTLPAAIVLSIPHIVNTYFSHKAIYNYETVYLRLKERKGFPNFVFSTADMYADKIYLKNKDEKTVAEKRVEASFNPFNEEDEIIDEEVRRMNSLRYEEMPQHEKDVAGAYYEEKEIKYTAEQEREYKYKFSILGIDIVIPHNDFKTAPMDEKRFFMGVWNETISKMFRNEAFMIMMLMLLILTANVGGMGFGAAIYFVSIAVYVFGTNFIKFNQIIGVPLIIGSVFSFCSSIGNNMVAAGFVIVVLAFFCITMLPGLIKFTINFPAYKKISREPGFPSFVENSADLYADEVYIVEKPKPIVKMEKPEPIIMDIGYDEEDKNKRFKEFRRINEFNYQEQNKSNRSLREDKGWNAFDYLDTDKENSAYDDFEYYEQVYEARKNAKPREEKQIPDKDMGRRKRDED